MILPLHDILNYWWEELGEYRDADRVQEDGKDEPLLLILFLFKIHGWL